MKLIALPLLFSVGYVAFEHRDRIIDQYNAAYPNDPARSAALAKCATRDPDFIRLDADDRERCYRAVFGDDRTALQKPAQASPYYPVNPSSLPGSDVRRQQASENFRPAERSMNVAAPIRIAAHAAAPAHHWQTVQRTEVKAVNAIYPITPGSPPRP